MVPIQFEFTASEYAERREAGIKQVKEGDKNEI